MQTAQDGGRRRNVKTWHGLYRRRVLVVLCSLILGTHPGHAAMLKMSVEDLARQADTIVVGTVTQRQSAWDAQHTAIYTDVTVAVERVLAGTPGDTLTLRVAGGIVEGMGMGTSNDPTFQDGEQMIVFLDTTTIPSSVVGMQQGKFTIKDNLVTLADETVSLEAFIATVRSALP